MMEISFLTYKKYNLWGSPSPPPPHLEQPSHSSHLIFQCSNSSWLSEHSGLMIWYAVNSGLNSVLQYSPIFWIDSDDFRKADCLWYMLHCCSWYLQARHGSGKDYIGSVSEKHQSDQATHVKSKLSEPIQDKSKYRYEDFDWQSHCLMSMYPFKIR